MSAAALKDDRLVDLLVKQATEGCTPEEQAEIERLFASYPDPDRDLIARTTAALALAGDFEEEPLPADLREKLRGNAVRWLAGRESKVADLSERREVSPTTITPAKNERRTIEPSRWPWFAAAACLLLAVAGWWPRMLDKEVQRANVQSPEPPTTQSAPVELTPAQRREQLLASGAGIVSISWSNTDDPASHGVSGDVVWDNATQTGYMRFSGLAANDPQQSQYQLWIFDTNQDERYPIDGGVFDVPAGAGEVIVPITAKIAVREPVMFAVTIEKPGGVVVSGREHLVTLAKTAAG